jgi:NAD-dependent dihydropyrimidine dehydrogenase PreA subunit
MMRNVYDFNTLQYDSQLCSGCRMCSIVCPHQVFEQNGKIAELIHPKDCMECGACQLNCPSDAITVDSGVGCATAMMIAAVKGKKEPTCGCVRP